MPSSSIASLLVRSLKHLTKRDLFPLSAPSEFDALVLKAPFCVIAQNAAPDPTLLYANSAASALFGLDAKDVGTLPTRFLGRDERARSATAAVNASPRGLFSESTSGVRVSKDGSRAFKITDATIWQVLDADSTSLGTAAMFKQWQEVPVTSVSSPAPPAARVTLVDVRVKPHFVELFRVLSIENARKTLLTEPGCLRFDIVQDADDATHFTLVEMFSDEGAERAHKETLHYKVWRDTVESLMASPRTAKKGASVWTAAATALQ
jgi:autoinducer 2-degrading protein